MKKKNGAGLAGSSIYAMWNKASKAKKIDETSTPNQIVVESSASHDEVQNNLQLALVQTADEEREPANSVGNAAPIVEDDLSTDEDDEATHADLQALKHDPGKRIPISRYAVNDQDRVRRRYIEMGPCQPKNHKFFVTVKSGKDRRFCHGWFAEFPWIEYSVEKEAAFCFVCYLFKDKTKCPGGDSFVKDGFRNWNMKSRLVRHEGGVGSAHAEAQEKFDMFCTPRASIRASLCSSNSQYKALYLQRLTWTLKCLRFLLHQGLE